MKNRFWTSLLIIVVLAGLAAIGLFSGRFVVYLTMRVMILAIFAMGYNILLGRTGLLSFGHAAFYAGGAYGLGLFSIHVSPNPLLGILMGVLLACVLALIIGFFCVRHTEIYFAMLTLAFGMMVFSLIWNMREITGGDDGLVGIMRAPISLGFVSIPLLKTGQYYFFVLFWFVVSVWVIHLIRHSPFGLVLSGLRENDRRIEFAGLSVKNYRSGLFCHFRGFRGSGRRPGGPPGKQYQSFLRPLEPLGGTDPGEPHRRHPDLHRPHGRERHLHCFQGNYRTLHPELDALARHYPAGHHHGTRGEAWWAA